MGMALACGGSSERSAAPPPAVVTTVVAPGAEEAPGSASSAASEAKPAFAIAEDGELNVPSPVAFRVRPLAGPGSMGPSELAPESDAALEHVAAYLRAHPGTSLRVECAVHASRLSSGPNAARGAYLAHLVARSLVGRGVDCGRLEAAGVVEEAPDAPAEKVRFLLRWQATPNEARKDPCEGT